MYAGTRLTPACVVQTMLLDVSTESSESSHYSVDY
jgi:hypothetical protein